MGDRPPAFQFRPQADRSSNAIPCPLRRQRGKISRGPLARIITGAFGRAALGHAAVYSDPTNARRAQLLAPAGLTIGTEGRRGRIHAVYVPAGRESDNSIATSRY